MSASRVKVLTMALGRAWRLGAGPPKREVNRTGFIGDWFV